MKNVFTYGSLMFGEVWRPLAQRASASMAATLEGYRREGVRSAHYPGIVPASGASTPGRLYFDVDAGALERLDAFEGSEYRRVAVSVHVDSADGRRVWLDAEVYVFIDAARLDGRPWDAERFGRDDAAGFYRAHSVE